MARAVQLVVGLPGDEGTEVKETLQKFANKQDRSLSNLVYIILREWAIEAKRSEEKEMEDFEDSYK